jgi:hypothetical protein
MKRQLDETEDAQEEEEDYVVARHRSRMLTEEVQDP